MKAYRTLAWLVTVLVCTVAWAAPAAAFEVSYNYYCYATGSDGIPIRDYDTLEGEWFFAGDHTKTGAAGNYGTARFYADLSTATVSVFAHSHGLQTGPYDFPSGTGRVERIEFEDHLLFTVPAGFYADGVQVSLLGRAQGAISSDVGATVQARCTVRLGSGVFAVELIEVGIEESGTVVVDEAFTVTAELVAPGSTLNESQEFSEIVRAGIYRAWTSSNAYNPGGGSVIGDAEIDFEDGLRILAVQVPPGVVWTSESGLFPGLPSPVPDEPTTFRIPRLGRIFPNPFNPRTTITFDLPRPTRVRLSVLDVAGRSVAVLVDNETASEGYNEVSWNGRDAADRPVSAGVYFCRLEAGGHGETKRMVLVR
ncbi:MAG: T9SS type A sorting domain-containing protein [bacterium]|nr:T9SS type A sorting domain-containing protein [bacterium]